MALIGTLLSTLHDSTLLVFKRQSVVTPMASLARMCWICGTAVSLEDCKIDEHGNVVHGKCYAAKMRSRYDGGLRPWRQIAQDLSVEHEAKRCMRLALELIEALKTDSDRNASQSKMTGKTPTPKAQ